METILIKVYNLYSVFQLLSLNAAWVAAAFYCPVSYCFPRCLVQGRSYPSTFSVDNQDPLGKQKYELL